MDLEVCKVNLEIGIMQLEMVFKLIFNQDFAESAIIQYNKLIFKIKFLEK
jgi:hypothetical protein